MADLKLDADTIKALRAAAADLAPAGRNAFPAITGLMSSRNESGEWVTTATGPYSEESTLKCVRGVFMRMLDAAEGIEVYRPSNGTEGDIFQSQFCENCSLDNLDDATGEGGCEILVHAMIFDIEDVLFPREWRVVDGKPTCTAFRQRTAEDHAKLAQAAQQRRYDALPRDPVSGRPVVG